MHVVRVVSRRGETEYVSHLLRNSYREGNKVKKQTLANLSHLPEAVIDLIRGALAGVRYVPADSALEIRRSLPHGHVAAVLGMVRKLGLDRLICPTPSRERDLAVGMIVSRVLSPCSKAATAREWELTTLGEMLGTGAVTDDELYDTLDWLLSRQQGIEKRLGQQHLEAGSLVLYDVSSTYVEGTRCPLAAHGYSRDQRRDRQQIVFGLTADREGRPLAVEAFAGNTADPATVDGRVQRLRDTYGLEQVVLVGDRGMLTQTRIEKLQELGGVGWVSCLRAPAIQQLCRQEVIQPSLFDERNLAEVHSPDYPGERLIVCRNPLLAEERRRKREELLACTERELGAIAQRVAAGRLVEAGKIGQQVGKKITRWKMAKHFGLKVADGVFEYERLTERIAEEAQLDGLYVVRTSLRADQCSAAEVVETYKSLSQVEQVFRSMKSVDLEVRPIFHYKEERVRAHLFVCLLAAYVIWHLQRAWASLLFREEQPPQRADPVAPAPRSQEARRKESTAMTPDGLPVHSFRTLLRELATMSCNWIAPCGADREVTFKKISCPTELQTRAFELIGVQPGRV